MLTFTDCTQLPALRTLLHVHGATLLLTAAVAADDAIGCEPVAPEHLAALVAESAHHIAEAAFDLSPMQRVALCGSSCPHCATRYLSQVLPTALLDVLTALCGPEPEVYAPLYGPAFALVHDYGITCHSVDATPNWLEFMQFALTHPVKS